MAITLEQYAQALHDALSETDAKSHDAVINNFVSVLKSNNDLDKYEKIIDTFEVLSKADATKVHAEVTTATPMERNKEILETLNHLAGKEAHVTHKVDENIIGGVVIKVDDTLVDASIKGQLSKLKKALSK